MKNNNIKINNFYKRKKTYKKKFINKNNNLIL